MVPNLDQDPNISVSKQIDVYFSEVVQKEAKEKEGQKRNNTYQCMDTRFLSWYLPLSCMKQGCQNDNMLVMYLKGIEWHHQRDSQNAQLI
jgi:hypothetical protein